MEDKLTSYFLGIMQLENIPKSTSLHYFGKILLPPQKKIDIHAEEQFSRGHSRKMKTSHKKEFIPYSLA